MPQIFRGKLLEDQYDYYMKVRCDKCKEIFEIPYSDRVNVFLFDHPEKYHKCPEQIKKVEYVE